MDIEKLIEEQKKTNEILLRMEKAGTFEKFFEDYEAAVTVEEMDYLGISPWDYEESMKAIQITVSKCFRDMGLTIGKIKKLLSTQKDFYEFHIRRWEKIREHNRGREGKEDVWLKEFTNPDCIKFFDDYEKDHGIKWSIAQEAKRERIAKKGRESK